MSKALRDKIILLLQEHARSDSPYFKEDEELAVRLGESVGEIQRQLDILESQGLISSANAREGRRARISPQGYLLAEELEEWEGKHQADLQSLVQDLSRKVDPSDRLAAHLDLSEDSIRALMLASDKDLRHLHPEMVRRILEVANSLGVRSFGQSLEIYSRWQPRSRAVFLCHSSSDKLRVREICQRLRKDGMNPWLDEENLLPGQNWQEEITKALRESDIVIVFLSQSSVSKTGFVQKEVKLALDGADLRPPGAIFLIPARLEACDVPDRLRHLQWVDLFAENGYEKLLNALTKARLELEASIPPNQAPAADG